MAGLAPFANAIVAGAVARMAPWVWLVCGAACLAAAIVLYVVFADHGAPSGRRGLAAFVNFDRLLLAPVARFCYLLLAVAGAVFGAVVLAVGCIEAAGAHDPASLAFQALAFVGGVAVAEVVLRISFELVLVLVKIVENTAALRRALCAGDAGLSDLGARPAEDGPAPSDPAGAPVAAPADPWNPVPSVGEPMPRPAAPSPGSVPREVPGGRAPYSVDGARPGVGAYAAPLSDGAPYPGGGGYRMAGPGAFPVPGNAAYPEGDYPECACPDGPGLSADGAAWHGDHSDDAFRPGDGPAGGGDVGAPPRAGGPVDGGVPATWDCACGSRGNAGAFCGQCGAARPRA